jgi:hypothetical protein
MGVGPYTGADISSPLLTLPGGLAQGLLIDMPAGRLTFGANPLPKVASLPGWFYTTATVKITYNGLSVTTKPATTTIDSGGIGGGASGDMLPPTMNLDLYDPLPAGTIIELFTPDGSTLLYRTTVTDAQVTAGQAPELWPTSFGFNTGVIPFLQGPIYFSYTPAYVPNPDDFYGGTTEFDFAPAV